MISYRKANAEDIYPALELALKVFMEYNAPGYEPISILNFKTDCVDNQSYIDSLKSGENVMFVALSDKKIIGMAAERKGHVWLLFVDGAFHRQGIATTLMGNIVCALKLKGYDKIFLDSSPYAIPFYLNFGFSQIGEAKNKYGCIVTPMSYQPNEIWDVLDEHWNKTGRYHERGRKMPAGDYHLVVHAWKHNGRGEWLIDRRSQTRGTSVDGKWETTGGSAIAGDDGLTAALRETKEELGIDLNPQNATLFHRTVRQGNDGQIWLQEAWVFEWNGSIDEISFQCGHLPKKFVI